jgi:hypothetical protein
MILRFSDGVVIQTHGPLRVVRLEYGFYVVGEGFCIPVSSYHEGEKTIEKMQRDINDKRDI